MNTPMPKLTDPADILLEFVEVLAKIDASPERIKRNSVAMLDAEGVIITY